MLLYFLLTFINSNEIISPTVEDKPSDSVEAKSLDYVYTYTRFSTYTSVWSYTRTYSSGYGYYTYKSTYVSVYTSTYGYTNTYSSYSSTNYNFYAFKITMYIVLLILYFVNQDLFKWRPRQPNDPSVRGLNFDNVEANPTPITSLNQNLIGSSQHPYQPPTMPQQPYLPPQNYMPPPQGYPQPPQGYMPPPQGYAPPPPGYVPQQGGYIPPPNPYANNYIPPQ